MNVISFDKRWYEWNRLFYNHSKKKNRKLYIKYFNNDKRISPGKLKNEVLEAFF